MRIVIVGAGEVGSTIAESLADHHTVVVIDLDPQRVEALTYETDVLAVEGDGAALSTLEEATVREADLVIAATDDDETNIVTCGTVKTVSDAFTIARVRNTKYLDTWQHAEGALGVDHMVGTVLKSAEKIVTVIGLPGARDVDVFADGTVRMAEFEIHRGSPIAGQTVAEADRFDCLTFAAVLRNESVLIPRGDTTLRTGDEVIVIGTDDSVRSFGNALEPDVDAVGDVLIVGGSDIGYNTARLLEERNLSPRMVESDPELARDLAERLPNTTVYQSDPTDRDFLERENIQDVDVVVAALERDEANLLAGLLAKRLGARKAIAVVDVEAYVSLFEAVGIDVAIHPREVAAEEITRFTRKQRAENVALIESDRAEVLEIEVDADSVLANRTIKTAAKDLPDGLVIGAITRDGAYVNPRGDTVVEENDHVVVFVDAEDVEDALSKL